MSLRQPSEVSAESTPLNAPLPGRVRRASAAGRATAAVAAESFPLSLSPSPLLRVNADLGGVKPKPVKLTRPALVGKSAPAAVSSPKTPPPSTTGIAELKRVLDSSTEKPQLPNTSAPLSADALRNIFTFVSDKPRGLRHVATTCRKWYNASFPTLESLTLIPENTTIERLSGVGSLSPLIDYLSVATRGQHLKRLLVMRPDWVYQLPHTTFGPTVGLQALSALLINLPQLTELDVRGIQLRNYAPWCDHFLTDLAVHCPKIESLSVGAQFVRNWETQWWAPLTHMKKFVVGSRREDVDWHSNKPLTLSDDFFVMLRGSPALKCIKVWCALQTPSFTQLLIPSTSFPNLVHLSVNAQGNTQLKPFEETVPEIKEVASKKDVKGGKAKAQEEPPQLRVGFPVLTSLVVADVKERPEFATELLVRLSTSAPQLQHFNVVNSHRTGPGKVVAPPPSKTIRRTAA